jgi:hypothetical protein
MNKQRTGLQKSIRAIFAGATLPEEARLVCTYHAVQAKQADETPSDLLVGANTAGASRSD